MMIFNNLAIVLCVASVGAFEPRNPSNQLQPSPIDYPRDDIKINPKEAAENGYFDYKYVRERTGSHHHEHHEDCHDEERRKSSHHEEHKENPMAILNGVDYHPEPEPPHPDCTSFVPEPTCETPIPVPPCSTSSESILPTSYSSTPMPTPLPTSAATSSGCLSTVTVTKLADACTTIIICNPARTDCPNSAVASEVAKAVIEKGGVAAVNGVVVATINGSAATVTAVVSGSKVVQVSGAHVNAASSFSKQGGFFVMVIAFVVGAVVLF